MKAYRISGEFQMGRNWQPFTLETVADDRDQAEQWVLSTLGSRHRVSRRQIRIDDIHSESADEVEDPSIKFALEHEDEYKARKDEHVHV